MTAPGRQKRPNPAERRSLILQAAAEVFFDQGFSAASIDMIIDQIGGSKRTIYKEFGNKDALFTALVTEIADGALAAFERAGSDKHQDLRGALAALAQHLLAIYTSKELLGVYRAIVTEARRFPQLVRSIYERGPGRAARELKDVLDAAKARGEIRNVDTAMAADQFVGMMRDNLHLQIVLGLRDPPDDREIRQRANAAVELFLAGIAAEGDGRHEATVKRLPQTLAGRRRMTRRSRPD